jgi:hypothetical protein
MLFRPMRSIHPRATDMTPGASGAAVASVGARARAGAVREARLIRARMIRRRVIAGALSLFVATWLLITLMLVSGHDPALAARKTSTAAITSTATPTATGGGSGSATGGGATSSSGSGSTGTAGSGTTSAVTTQQS